MTGPPIRWWQELSAPEVPRLVERNPVVVLPLAAIEQHGPHLPLSTDLDIGLGLLTAALRQLPTDVPVLVLPPQAIGCSREHLHFAGTLSLGPTSLIEMIEETGAALAACGVRRLVLSNSHGGNRHAIEEAALRLREKHGMLVVKASWFRFPRPAEVSLPEREWTHGIHGGAVETAMMQYLRPDLVREEEVRKFISLGTELQERLRRIGPEGEASFAWLAGDLHPSGVVGDATLADRDMGKRLVEHYASVLAEVIRETRDFPLDRLRSSSPARPS
jgi:creatinine amidohydrolase